MNDFELDPEFDFDDNFDAEFELSDDMGLDGDDDDDGELMVRTAILQKNNMTALLCIKSATSGAAICRVDPRESLPAVQVYDDRDAAMLWFSRSLRSSKKNGWNIVYDGLPLNG